MNPTDLAQLYAIAVAAAAGWLIPGVVDLVTKSHLANGVKAFIAATLSALAGAVATVQITPATHWQTVLVAVAAAFANTMAAHQTGYSSIVQRVTAGFGMGPANPAPADPLTSTETAETGGAGVVGSGGYSLVELVVVAFIVVVILVVLVKVL